MKTAVVLYKHPLTRYSTNAVTASLDMFTEANIYVVEDHRIVIPVLENLRAKYDRIILGMSLLTYMLADDKFLEYVLMLTRYARSHGILAVAGGPHATGDPIGTIISLGFHASIIGEAEETFPELVNTISDGGEILDVAGIYTLDDGKPVYTGARRHVSLDDYPPFPYWRYMFNPIEITRGCPYGCKYCQVSYMHGRRMRHRSVDRIMEYAGHMARNGLRDLRFISPDSLAYGLEKASRTPAVDLVEELLYRLYRSYVEGYGMRIFYGTFPSEVRPEHLIPEALRVLKKFVANKEIILGAQSGSNRMLKLIGRGHTIEDVYEAVENTVRHGFRPDVDYIIGLPSETRDDLEETIKSMEKLVSMGARIHLHVFMPLPGTPYACAEPGRVPEWAKKRIARIIGMGAAYGQWLQQERLAAKIAELRRRGIIMPRRIMFSARLHQGSATP